MSNTKVLVCGYGKMGRVHAKYLKKHKIDWKWYDPHIENDNDAFCGDIKSLNQSGFTHIIIATPENTHFGIYKEIRSGFSGFILIEKPVILDIKDYSVFDDSSVLCGMVERFNPAVQALKSRIIPDNVVNIDFTRCSVAPSVSHANIFEDIGIHDLDLYVHLMDLSTLNSRICQDFKLSTCSKTYCLSVEKNSVIARFIWSKETFFKERKIVVRQKDCTYTVDLQEQTLKKNYIDDVGRNIVEQIYVEKSSPVENQLLAFIEGSGTMTYQAEVSHRMMFEILGAI